MFAPTGLWFGHGGVRAWAAICRSSGCRPNMRSALGPCGVQLSSCAGRCAVQCKAESPAFFGQGMRPLRTMAARIKCVMPPAFRSGVVCFNVAMYHQCPDVCTVSAPGGYAHTTACAQRALCMPWPYDSSPWRGLAMRNAQFPDIRTAATDMLVAPPPPPPTGRPASGMLLHRDVFFRIWGNCFVSGSLNQSKPFFCHMSPAWVCTRPVETNSGAARTRQNHF